MFVPGMSSRRGPRFLRAQAERTASFLRITAFFLAHACPGCDIMSVMNENQGIKLKMLAHLDMRHAASRETVGGILRFAAMHNDWEVQFAGAHPSNESLEHFADWHPDALVIDGSCHSLDARELSAISGRATVFVETPIPARWRKPCATLTTDDQALADEAAGLFRRKGLVHYAFIGSPGKERWSEARRRSFHAAVKKMGYTVHEFRQTGLASSWREQERELTDWLTTLPKPCGIWAAFDQRAKHVLDACRLAGLRVPNQIQVLGVDDETYICEQTVPSLSSLKPDFENGGFAAAEFLDGALKGLLHLPSCNGNRRTKLHFTFKGIVERLSTADVNGTARRIAAAREFIRKHATSGIDVPHIADALGISVRLLQRDYHSVTGRTVLEDLQSAKLEHAKELLRTTTIPIDSIGSFCDFKSPAYLKTLFKTRFGMTMSDYRASGHTLPAH